jgi:hypothetical protein
VGCGALEEGLLCPLCELHGPFKSAC